MTDDVPIRVLVNLSGLGGRRRGVRCTACGSGRMVRVYEIAGRTVVLDYMCAIKLVAMLLGWDPEPVAVTVAVNADSKEAGRA